MKKLHLIPFSQKNMLLLALPLCLLYLNWSISIAQTTSKVSNNNSKEKTYKVGIFEDMPLSFRDEDGGLKGIYVDILENIALHENWRLKYLYDSSFQKNLQNLEESKIDILVSIGYSEERAEKYDFNKETVLTNWGEIYVHNDTKIRSIIDLEGKKIAVMKGNVYYDGSHGLKSTAQQFGIDIEYVEAKSYANVLQMIARKEVDAGLVSVLYGSMHEAEYPVKGTPIVFHPIELRFAIRKGHPEGTAIIEAIDKQLAKLKADDESVYAQSIERWLNQKKGHVNYTWILVSIGSLLSLVLLFVVISYILKRQVAKRTKELFLKNKEIESLNADLERKVEERTAEVMKQKEEIEEQKKQLEQINKQMLASITYARNIQEALLPEHEKIAAFLRNYFMLLLPRDIVSGDYYWFAHKDGKSILALGDCTGHGVPGAFMSMLGSSSLDYIVHEKNIMQPSQILTELHNVVYRSLGTNAKDGMDIAICSFDFDARSLTFAGAQRPMYYIHDRKVNVIKGDSYPIGGSAKYANKRNYTDHVIELHKGDSVYLTSDGFADQFGGPDNRKYTTQRFRELLNKMQDVPIEEQKVRFVQEIDTWKGVHRQIDDILLFGMKVND